MEITLKPLPRKHGNTEQVSLDGEVIGIIHFAIASGGRESPFRPNDMQVCGTTQAGQSVGFHSDKDEIIDRLVNDHKSPKRPRSRRMDRRNRREAREEREDNRED